MKDVGHQQCTSSGFSHSVSRSNELLSCAKTSWKLLLQQKQEQQQIDLNSSSSSLLKKPNLRLASTTGHVPPSLVIVEDGLTLLRSMEYFTKKLQDFVRRRGHTNDPTQEIAMLVKQLEQDLKELTSFCEQLLKIRRRKQEKRHWELVVQWFQRVANHYSSQLQDCLKLRGEILAEQAQKRRKLVESKGKSKMNTLRSNNITDSAALSATSTPLFDSPLFTATPSKRTTTTISGTYDKKSQHHYSQQSNRNTTFEPSTKSNGPSSSSSTPYRSNNPATNAGIGTTYYGSGSSGYGGYGGVGYGHSGIRQRKGNYPLSNIPVQEQEEEDKVHTQIQMRERKRQTKQRLNEARQAESTLSEVTQLFGKMSTLITQQGETLEKIEDDVESALVDVSAGQEELTKLYSIKKGNRPLIMKTFLILNFLIIFMRTYHKK